jgi:16S rRNA processing protein RimM
MKKDIRIGKIVRAFGIKGELKVALKTDIPLERFKLNQPLMLQHEHFSQEVVISGFRIHQNHGLLKLDGFESINDVLDFVGADIMMTIETDDEVRVAFFDLVDCDVVENQITIGKVIEVLDMPAHPVLKILTPTKTIMIPYVDAFVVDVDQKNKIIHIKSIEGLL